MRFHLGILPHQCNICDYVAPDKATLIRHLRTHSGERPYVCRVCHYPFTVKANCERHLRKKHAKTSRKDIEKNIKYVTSTVTAAIAAPPATTQELEAAGAGAETTCRFCGEDLKTYRALQIHLRTHNGCQRKPFECRRCGAAFLAKRNCIHHLLKQHPEVQEREIEEHIATLLPAAAAAARSAPAALNGLGSPPVAVKVEEPGAVGYPAELDQPLDFSAKGRGGAGAPAASLGVKLESMSPTLDCAAPDQPIDLSVPSKRQRRDADVKTEHQPPALAPPKEEKAASGPPPLHPHPQLGCYQLPPGSTPPPASRAQRLKPLLPKPAAASSSSPSSALKELPPLASIAQIIHSVSGAPDLLKRDAASLEARPLPLSTAASHADAPADASGAPAAPEPQSEDKAPSLPLKEKLLGSSIDLESSGEFASVEKMLATTDANKFSPFLQSAELTEEGKTATVATAMSGTPPNKGKKNAYSNSVQKMTCPFCPRVFPWASSLQRHMLTHTGKHTCTHTHARARTHTHVVRPADSPSLRLQARSRFPVRAPAPSSSCSPSTPPPSASTPPAESPEDKEQEKPASSPPSSLAKPAEYKHTCRICQKCFRYATTLARHLRAHLTEPPAPEEEEKESKPAEEEGEEAEAEDGLAKGGESEAGESGESEDDDGEKEKEERSDEEASEPKSSEGGEAAGGRVDKRKKICNVCGKRFWSLQDLTRHTRSHTGERPYQCQTCERTFTLKHSLVRHQRIHLKPRGASDDASEDGDSCTPTPTSTCPPSENESDSGSAAKDEGEGPPDEPGDGEPNAADPDPPTAVASEPDAKDKEDDSAAPQQTDSNPSNQATDTKTTTGAGSGSSASNPESADSDASKDPAPSSRPPPEEAPPPADGFIQGLLEIHAKPPLEHLLANGESPLVGAD
uniref:Ras responsive element binding protein 1a n=1 Tax=Salarias fasciatus TaxID=181472 RepID=A0A672FUL0_SALFA